MTEAALIGLFTSIFVNLDAFEEMDFVFFSIKCDEKPLMSTLPQSDEDSEGEKEADAAHVYTSLRCT